MKHVACVGKMQIFPASTAALYTLKHMHICRSAHPHFTPALSVRTEFIARDELARSAYKLLENCYRCIGNLPLTA